VLKQDLGREAQAIATPEQIASVPWHKRLANAPPDSYPLLRVRSTAMHKLIHPVRSLLLLLGLTGVAESTHAAQICRSESEIPSSTPTSEFTDHGDGTVTHHATGLMWTKCPLGQSGSGCATGSANTYTWEAALEEAAGSSFAGYTDWRLPNIKELGSIVEKRCYLPAINEAVFPAMTTTYRFWSSSPNADYSGYAWLFLFNYGYSYYNSRYFNHSVRLVRSGQ
jgi:hypothetical protein